MTTQNGTTVKRPSDTQLARWAIAYKGIQPDSVILSYVMKRYGRAITKSTIQNVKQEVRKNGGRLPEGEGKVVEQFAQAAMNGVSPVPGPESVVGENIANRLESFVEKLKQPTPVEVLRLARRFLDVAGNKDLAVEILSLLK